MAAYIKWGIDFVNQLNGMFSFAIWDKRDRNFILGRDRMGIKPLYYAENNGAIVFASEIHSIEYDTALCGNVLFRQHESIGNLIPIIIEIFLG